jgi:DnaD/phage-associated family protein
VEFLQNKGEILMNTIFRVNKNKNYTVISNHALHNPNLSLRAKGLLAYLLSMIDDWKIYVKELVNHHTDGKDSINSAIRELIKHGYIIRELDRNEKGQLVGYIYQVFETPVCDNNPNYAESCKSDLKSDSKKSGLASNHCNDSLSTENGFTVSGQTEIGESATTKYLSKQILNEEEEETFLPVLKLFIKAITSIDQPQLKTISPLQKELLKKLVNKYSVDFVMKAIEVTAIKARTFNMDYLKKVLRSYEKNGYQTLTDIEDAENIENLKKENIEIKRKKNIDKQLATAPEKKSKAKNTVLDGDATYAETNEDLMNQFP